jgi:hypothetical protein
MIAAIAIGSDKFEDASREWSLGVQIVSRPPDQSFGPLTGRDRETFGL